MKVKIDPSAMMQLRTEFEGIDNEDILDELIDSFYKKKSLQEDYSLLLQSKSDLELELEDSHHSFRRLEKEMNSVIKNRDNLKKRYRSLCNKNETGKTDTSVVERIVYHEDRRTIEELRRKCHELKEQLWVLQRREKDNRLQLAELSQLNKRVADWKQVHHGVLLQSKNNLMIPDLNLRIIDNKAFFEYRADPDRFKDRYLLTGSYVVKELPYTD